MNQLLPLVGLILIISTAPLGSAQNIDYPDSFNEPMALFDEAMGIFIFLFRLRANSPRRTSIRASS